MFVCGLVSVALFCFAATGVTGFSVTTSNSDVKVILNQGPELTCHYSADFGRDIRLEWKFEDLLGSLVYVIFDGKPTESYASRVILNGNNLRFNKVTEKDSGIYRCEVSGQGQFKSVQVKLTVLVPPGVPVCRVPPTVTTGGTALLSCRDIVGSPPPTYKWFKDGVLLPSDPSNVAGFENATYKLNPTNGNLEFVTTTKMDTAAYFCVAENSAGPPQQCQATKMEVRDK